MSDAGASTAARHLDLPADLQAALDEAVRRIVEVAHPETVILFGSHAEGCAREGSDVDLLVVVIPFSSILAII